MIGRSVAQFEIQEKLGQGGMGVVYKAHDTKLNRAVALKFLPAQFSSDESAKARFIQEAQAASALDHANICSVYDIGETAEGEVFIAMAYYDGQTLKYRLSKESFSIDRAVDIARQIAKALERAHEAGIIHRDVKPANIMLTNRGEVKLLDFGLAKLAGGAELTMAGSTLGTAAYMSPEQARGSQVTTATDIWALGAVMYEMFTGEKPFSAEYDQALLYGILNEDPQPANELRAEIPNEISDLIQRCLSKTPGKRPQPEEIISYLGGSSSSMVAVTEPEASRPSVSEDSKTDGSVIIPASKRTLVFAAGIALIAVVAVVFWLIGGSGSVDQSPASSATEIQTASQRDRSVAVLPFKLRSATEEEASAVFAGGMHDDVLAQLSKIEDLKVIARTSVMQYENTTKTVREIASELNVASVLEGTIQRAGDRIRVNVSLVDGATESPLWSETYDEELTLENIFSIQSDLAQSIATALSATLSPQEVGSLTERPAIAMEAYDLFTRAMFLYRSTTSVMNAPEAAEMIQQALEIEPDYAQAQASLGGIYVSGMIQGIWAPDEVSNEARTHIERALELDPNHAGAYAARGSLAELELDFEGAEEAYLKAIEVAPGDPVGHRRYASLLYKLGRPDEALASSRRAVETDPLTTDGRENLADILFFTGQYEESIAETLKILEMEPENTWVHYNLGYSYAMLDRMDDAITEFEQAVAQDTSDPINAMGLGWAHAKAGHHDEALAIIADVEDNPAMLREKAIILGILGDLDTAFEYLDRAFEENPGAVSIIAGDTSVPDAMRNDPRFAELVKKLGL